MDDVSDEGTSPKTDKFIENVTPKRFFPKIISMLPGKDVGRIEFEEIKTAIICSNQRRDWL